MKINKQIYEKKVSLKEIKTFKNYIEKFNLNTINSKKKNYGKRSLLFSLKNVLLNVI